MDPSAPSAGGRSASNGSHLPNLNGSQLPERSPSRSSSHPSASHRHSFVENLRNPPPSPRSHRHPSLNASQAAQGLLNHPPPQRQPNPRFAGRDWHDIAIGELVSEEAVKWAEMDTSVEDCTKILLRPTQRGAVLLRNRPTDKMPVASFDHSDLNAYLLVVIGMAKPEPEDVALYQSITQRAQEHAPIPVRDIQPISRKEPMEKLSFTQHLPRAIELFGSGVHRILVTNQASTEVVGVLSQLRLVEFFWNESVNFPVIDRLYSTNLRDLRIGSQEIVAINADRPLADALTLMNNEGLTSIAVVDNGYNVVGNISTTDVEHLTSVTSFPLLQSSCMHFISVILSERGMDDGRDSFPVFYVNPHSTLAHTVAKLVATRSHRVWVVDSPSPSPSAPQTPLLVPAHTGSSVSSTGPSILPAALNSTSATSSTEALSSSGGNTGSRRESTILVPPPHSTSPGPQSPVPVPSHSREQSFSSVPASAMPGAHLSGRLTGVVSLSDILNLFAKTTGLRPTDPSELRAHRRRSSSSSLRPSLDGPRSSFDLLRR